MPLPRRISAVVFDMDGTLHDTEALYFAALKEAAAAVGFPLTDQFCHSLIGIPGPETDVLLRAHLGPGFPFDEYDRLYHAAVARHLAEAVPLKAGAAELLQSLAGSGFRTAVATSARRAAAERHLQRSGLRPLLSALVTRDDVARGKPYPDLFLLAAERLEVSPAECLAVEDSLNGIRAAFAAGTMPVMVPDLVAPTDEIRAMCVRIARDLNEVGAIIAGAATLRPRSPEVDRPPA